MLIDMHYELATESDKPYFQDLNRACYETVVEQQFGAWDDAFQQQNFNTKWQGHNFHKIIVGGEVVGGVWVEDHGTHLHLREIQIHPRHQNRGLGTAVLQDVIARSQFEGKRLQLRVLHLNKAFSLYKRLGFEVIEKMEAHYLMARA